MELKDIMEAVNYTKPEITQEVLDRDYNPYLVNRCLSYFTDTIFHANEMNCVPGMCKVGQYDYLRHSIRKKRRFAPWVKKEKNPDIEAIKKAFGYNEHKAKDALNILGQKDLEIIRKSVDTGGVRK